MGKWEEISDVLTEEGRIAVKPGQVLVFDYEGSEVHLKIKRKAGRKVFAEKVRLYLPEEVDIIDKEENIKT
jgi:hypothetical protein